MNKEYSSLQMLKISSKKILRLRNFFKPPASVPVQRIRHKLCDSRKKKTGGLNNSASVFGFAVFQMIRMYLLTNDQRKYQHKHREGE